jgi:hypothetical protein
MIHLDLVENNGLLVEAMGYWPSFHDAKVLSVSRLNNSCVATIHVFQMTSEVGSKGYFALGNHHLVEISMIGVHGDSLPRHYTGDVLSTLAVRRDGDLIRVDFESHLDNDGSIVCERVRLVSVEPCDRVGTALHRKRR